MKIAQICPYSVFRSGGVQDHVKELSEELRHRGHEVKIIAPGMKGDKRKIKDVIFLGSYLNVAINKTKAELTFVADGSRRISHILQKEKFDILHFHEPTVPMLSLQIIAMSDSVNIATFHAAFPNTFMGQTLKTLSLPILDYLVKVLDAIIAVSSVPAQIFKETYDGKINIIPNGIDLVKFSPDNETVAKYRDGKINILFVGRLDKRKGVIYLVRAVRELKKICSNVRLIIAGTGTESNRIRKCVRRYNLQDVELLGYVNDEMKQKLYATCDIFCSPALYGESFGIVLLEAMASGKPVVAYANPGYRSVLKKRGSLLLVKPKDINGLAQKLHILCKDKHLREFMGQWGLEEAKKYSWTSVCDQVLDVYEKVIIKQSKKDSKVEKSVQNFVDKAAIEIKQAIGHGEGK